MLKFSSNSFHCTSLTSFTLLCSFCLTKTEQQQENRPSYSLPPLTGSPLQDGVILRSIDFGQDNGGPNVFDYSMNVGDAANKVKHMPNQRFLMYDFRPAIPPYTRESLSKLLMFDEKANDALESKEEVLEEKDLKKCEILKQNETTSDFRRDENFTETIAGSHTVEAASNNDRTDQEVDAKVIDHLADEISLQTDASNESDVTFLENSLPEEKEKTNDAVVSKEKELEENDLKNYESLSENESTFDFHRDGNYIKTVVGSDTVEAASDNDKTNDEIDAKVKSQLADDISLQTDASNENEVKILENALPQEKILNNHLNNTKAFDIKQKDEIQSKISVSENNASLPSSKEKIERKALIETSVPSNEKWYDGVQIQAEEQCEEHSSSVVTFLLNDVMKVSSINSSFVETQQTSFPGDTYMSAVVVDVVPTEVTEGNRISNTNDPTLKDNDFGSNVEAEKIHADEHSFQSVKTKPIEVRYELSNSAENGDGSSYRTFDETLLSTHGRVDDENEAMKNEQRNTNNNDKDANREFVTGLDEINKLFENVSPPDELDVGADGSSIQEVLIGQGLKIIFKRIESAGYSIKKQFGKAVRKALPQYVNWSEVDKEINNSINDSIQKMKNNDLLGDQDASSQLQQNNRLVEKGQPHSNGVIKPNSIPHEKSAEISILKIQTGNLLWKFTRRKWVEAMHLVDEFLSFFEGSGMEEREEASDLFDPKLFGMNMDNIDSLIDHKKISSLLEQSDGSIGLHNEKANIVSEMGSEVDELFLKSRFEAMKVKDRQSQRDTTIAS